MRVLNYKQEIQELPFKTLISFEGVFDYFEQQIKDKNNLFYDLSKNIINQYKDLTILRDGFEDYSLLNTYSSEIDDLTSVLFPGLLQSNEIKALAVPFDLTSFKLSKRFEKIIKNAGKDYIFQLRNFEYDNQYVMSCTYILSMVYDHHIDFTRPFFYDIPDLKAKHTKTYRALFNADFINIIKTDKAPDLTEKDFIELVDHIDDINIWKEKFPPNSYIFKGFGIMNLFDVTQEQTISLIKSTLVERDTDSFGTLEKHIQNLYHIDDLKLGFSIFNKRKDTLVNFKYFNSDNSLIIDEDCNCKKGYFCNPITEKLFSDFKTIAISDVDNHRITSGNSPFYKKIANQNIQSIILSPLDLNDDFMAILEVASPKKTQLNSLNAIKLKDIIPVLKIATIRSIEEHQNQLESTIQEHYTTIHPSVKWKFYEKVDYYLNEHLHGNTEAGLESISFKQVYPLYGQCDIKNSSDTRNNAIQKDLMYQLNLSKDILDVVSTEDYVPIYGELKFRIQNHITTIETNLSTGDELQLIDFFKKEVYPLFKHLLKIVSVTVKNLIRDYFNQIDDTLQIIYKERKIYEDFINKINSKLSKHLDKKQKQAQKIFPHYYERFKTDGLEYNMYVGASIDEQKDFHPIYIKNLRLWQLEQQCELVRLANDINIADEKIDLEVASLILVHSQPLDIQFRMDEKKFDVDGAYNIRYEIIKKRIDKSYIKNTKERLTQPGKIAIVYTHEKDAFEYIKYIDFLKTKGYIKGTTEFLAIEDLQSVSGLKALRIEVSYI